MVQDTPERDAILRRLDEDLIGPSTTKEVLTARPSDVYVTGILWPRSTKMGAEDDDKLGMVSTGEEDTGESSEEEAVSLMSLMRPCTAGVSFAASASGSEVPEISVTARFATYEPLPGAPDKEGDGTPDPKNRPRILWHRRPHTIVVPRIRVDRISQVVELAALGAPTGVKLHLRGAEWDENAVATATLINDAVPDDSEGRNGVERAALFQTGVSVAPCPGTRLIARPSRKSLLDDQDRSSALLYRNAREFAAGHTCSAEWTLDADSWASSVATTWIPRVTVRAMSAAGHKLFDPLRRPDGPLSASWLATAASADMGAALAELPLAYGDWISLQEGKFNALPGELSGQAELNLAECRLAQKRMAEGVERICGSTTLTEAFRLANRAMVIQHSWNPEKQQRALSRTLRHRG